MTFPIFVISLPDSTERRRAISDAMSEQGLPFTFFDGLDARNGVPEHFRNRLDPSAAMRHLGRPMTNGEYGAALSHALLYEQLLREGHEQALIMEDDAIPQPGLAAFLKARDDTIAPLVLLHHMNARGLRNGAKTLRSGGTAYPLAKRCFRATGYTANRAALEWLADKTRRIGNVADWPGDITELGAMALDPQLIDHPPISTAQSTIAATRPTRGRPRLHRFLDPAYFRQVIRKAKSIRIS